MKYEKYQKVSYNFLFQTGVKEKDPVDSVRILVFLLPEGKPLSGVLGNNGTWPFNFLVT